ncbi:MAG: beta-phosphoglucomutase [Alteromonadaceae bacterium]|nr:MAG: beta-phosphoglucomutase [Alteromonadaceae bacterium]
MNFDNFDALIFDMDGTLIDSGKLHEHAWSDTLKTFGIPIDAKLMRSLAGVPTDKTIVHLAQHFNITLNTSVDEIRAHKEAFVDANLKQFIKPTTLSETLRCYSKVKPCAVGTGSNTEEAHKILDFCQLLPLIDHIVGADQVANPKPAPDTFLRCAELLQVPARNCIVFEDAALGIEAAQNAQMQVIDVAEKLGIINDYFSPKLSP